MVWFIIPLSPTDSIICTVKYCYVNGLDVFAMRNNTATINDVANDKSCAVDSKAAFKTICLHLYDE